MNYITLMLGTGLLIASFSNAFYQIQNQFTQKQTDSILSIGAGISGPGKLVNGNGGGGWSSGSGGVQYRGACPKAE